MGTYEEIVAVMYSHVRDLLCQVVNPAEAGRIDFWIDDFLNRNPYNMLPIDDYLRLSGRYFAKIEDFVLPRKIGILHNGIDKIVRDLSMANASEIAQKELAEAPQDSLGERMSVIISRLEKGLEKTKKK